MIGGYTTLKCLAFGQAPYQALPLLAAADASGVGAGVVGARVVGAGVPGERVRSAGLVDVGTPMDCTRGKLVC